MRRKNAGKVTASSKNWFLTEEEGEKNEGNLNRNNHKMK